MRVRGVGDRGVEFGLNLGSVTYPRHDLNSDLEGQR